MAAVLARDDNLEAGIVILELLLPPLRILDLLLLLVDFVAPSIMLPPSS